MPVLLCYDGSPSAQQAISIARATLSHTNTTILLHVWSPPVAFLADSFSDPGVTADPPEIELTRLSRERAQAVADEGRQLALSLGLEVEIRLAQNDSSVAETILAVVREVEPDLVVIGTHGATAFVPELLGSVCADVVRQSTRPVLIVPSAGKDERHDAGLRERELDAPSLS